MELLPTLWFIAIAVLWTGFILLDGFDLGVGMLMLTSTRDERQRRQMLNTIGPVWDGNEVWLITAAAGLFAAFPDWSAKASSHGNAPSAPTATYLRPPGRSTWPPSCTRSSEQPTTGPPYSNASSGASVPRKHKRCGASSTTTESM